MEKKAMAGGAAILRTEYALEMELASLSSAEAPSVEGEKTKIAGKGERPEKWKIGGAQRKTGIPRAPRFASLEAPRAYFSPLPISQPVRRED